jgi:hypothetical protein
MRKRVLIQGGAHKVQKNVHIPMVITVSFIKLLISHQCYAVA